MSNLIRRWQETQRYRVTARQLRALSSRELRALWITSADIDRLARNAAQI